MKDMTRLTVFILVTVTSSVFAAPADNDQLDKRTPNNGFFINAEKEVFRSHRELGYHFDKATVNDVAVNTVSEEKKVSQTVQGANPPASTVEISGITTGANAPPSPPVENTPFKPQRAGSMFARFIDDIFQIPITVLQNVARLITNPFTQKKPDVVATVS
ncbi:uncharacterized protein isoform X1 [Leptinotarsa decemlineata]|uniref:uncharacterized protein isoform X1 n=1 Tax=Leptinotarsa decemlineata TaxID=7539 RepID=UPI000C25403D|nr:uncharacterized protein LOC111510100 [Leptinotarsa decemlineata]